MSFIADLIKIGGGGEHVDESDDIFVIHVNQHPNFTVSSLRVNRRLKTEKARFSINAQWVRTAVCSFACTPYLERTTQLLATGHQGPIFIGSAMTNRDTWRVGHWCDVLAWSPIPDA